MQGCGLSDSEPFPRVPLRKNSKWERYSKQLITVIMNWERSQINYDINWRKLVSLSLSKLLSILKVNKISFKFLFKESERLVYFCETIHVIGKYNIGSRVVPTSWNSIDGSPNLRLDVPGRWQKIRQQDHQQRRQGTIHVKIAHGRHTRTPFYIT